MKIASVQKMLQETITTRLAVRPDVDKIIAISTQVQEALTASGSLQLIGPLQHALVTSAIGEDRCFVAVRESDEVVGCILIRPIDQDFFPPSSAFSIADCPKPWQYLHSMMLLPESQGRGYGLNVFEDVMRMLAPGGGTVLLDCWAGNDKLRSFYANAGCQYVATVPEDDYGVAVFVRVLQQQDAV